MEEVNKDIILELNRLYNIIIKKPPSGYGGRGDEKKRSAFALMINIWNTNGFPKFERNKSSCGSCAKNFIANVKKEIDKWLIEKK